MRLHDRVAIVTGAAQGIGAACARVFAEEGARVVVSDLNEVGGTALVRDIAAAGGTALFARADVGAKADAERLVRFAVEHFGRLDILVSNAGIVHGAEFLDLAEDDFDRVLRVNLKGAFLCGQAAARQMVSQEPRAHGERGVIINMSSVNAVLAIPNQVPYVVSKGALNQLTKVMALALAGAGRAGRRHRPGVDRDRTAQDRRAQQRGGARAHHVAHAARTPRRTRGSGARRAVPRERRRLLPERHDDLSGRRAPRAELHRLNAQLRRRAGAGGFAAVAARAVQ